MHLGRVSGNQSQPSIKARQILSHFTDVDKLGGPDEGGLFVLSGFGGRRITAVSQQSRALSLVEALVSERRLKQGTRVGIIGGGVTGCTAAYWAVRHGAEVTIYEKESTLLNVYSKATHRYLHPGLFNWPQPGWQSEATHLLCMNWEFGTAQQVEQKLRTKVEDLRSEVGEDRFSSIHDPRGFRLVSVKHSDIPAVEDGAGNQYRHDLVLVAVGNGGYQGRGPGYWDGPADEKLFKELRSRAVKRIILVGNGDGGLMDVLRMKTPLFDEAKVVEFLADWRRRDADSLERVEQKILEKEPIRTSAVAESQEIIAALGSSGRAFWTAYLKDQREPWQKELQVAWLSRRTEFHAGASPLLRMLMTVVTHFETSTIRRHSKDVDLGKPTLPDPWDDSAAAVPLRLDDLPSDLRILDRVALTRPIEELQSRSSDKKEDPTFLRVADLAKSLKPIEAADFFSVSYQFKSIRGHGDSDSHASAEELRTDAQLDPATFQSRYAELLRDECARSAVPILGSSSKRKSSSQSDKSSQGDSLTVLSVYTAMQVRTEPVSGRGEATEMERMSPPVALLNALSASSDAAPRWILMGEGGRGKTTLSNFLVRALLCDDPISENLEDDVREEVLAVRKRWPGVSPILIRLRDLSRIELTDEDSFEGVLSWSAFRALHWDLSDRDRRLASMLHLVPERFREGCHAWLAKGSFLLILDGMDEIAGDDRPDLALVVQRFANSEAGRRFEILLTARTAAVRSADAPWYPAVPWPLLEIQSLSGVTPKEGFSQQHRFASRYLRQLGSPDPVKDATTLLDQVRHRRIEGLAAEPLLLSGLAKLYRSRPVGSAVELPATRVQILDQVIRLLIHDWDEKKGLKSAIRRVSDGMGIGEEVSMQALRTIAAQVLENGDGSGDRFRFPAEDLKEILLKVLNERRARKPSHNALDLCEALSERAGILRRVDGGAKAVLEFAVATYANFLAGTGWMERGELSSERVTELHRDRSAAIEHLRQAIALGVAACAEGLFPASPSNRSTDVSRVWPLLQALSTAAQKAQAEDLRRELFRTLAEAVQELGLSRTTLSAADEQELGKIRSEVLSCFSAPPDFPRTQAAIGMALGWLGDSRPGVGLKQGKPDLLWTSEIPAGKFLMGSEKKDSEFADEKPQFDCSFIQHPYVLGRYPVTGAQFEAFVASGGYRDRRYWTDHGWDFIRGEGKPDYSMLPEDWRERYRAHVEGESFPLTRPRRFEVAFEVPNAPVVGVSWYEAVAFCNWLNQTQDLTAMGLKPGWQIRLPTEAEWERAASYRGNQKRKYPWGQNPEVEKRANCKPTGIKGPSAVGLFGGLGTAGCGAEELIGNTWEWCGTGWTENYQGYEKQSWVKDELNPKKARQILEEQRLRVVRGGSWYYDPVGCRAAFRNWYHPEYRSLYLGFRVAASPISGLWSL